MWRLSSIAFFTALLIALLAIACSRPDVADSAPEDEAQPTTKTGTAELAASPETAPFLDETEESGPTFTHWNGMTGELYFSEMVGPGGAFFDFDADGDLDAFLVQGSPLREGDDPMKSILPPKHPLPLRDRLYRNDLEIAADGTAHARFVDITEQTHLDSHGYGMGVASGDIDNDGFPDLYVTRFGANQMLSNQHDGTFEDATERTGTGEARWSVSAVFLDFDRDGWLDLFVGNYVDYSIGTHKKCRAATGALDYCGPHSYRALTDRLFRNRGDGTFEDVTSRLGIDRAAGGALGVVGADFDLDGWPDLYVANDGSANFLWTRSQAEGFSDDALLRGAALNRDGHAEAGMGVDAGDYDNDGDEDIFLSHLTQETNTLYQNLGNATFDDTTSVVGLGAPSWDGTGFGTGFLDFDNDGWLDLVVLNGAVKVIDALRRQGDVYPLHQRNQLYRNQGDGTFVELDGGDAFAPSEVSRGAVFGDVDNDGDMDLLVMNNAGPARLLVNRLGTRQHFLGVRLVGPSGRDMLGAWAELVRPSGKSLFRRAHTGGSYASARDPRILFGLGEDPAVSAVVVRWPDGRRERFETSAVDRYVTFAQGEGAEL